MTEEKTTRTMSDVGRRIGDLVRKQDRLVRIVTSIAEEIGGSGVLKHLEQPDEMALQEGTGSIEHAVHRLDHLHDQGLYLRNVLYAIQGIASADDEVVDAEPDDEREGDVEALAAARRRVQGKWPYPPSDRARKARAG